MKRMRHEKHGFHHCYNESEEAMLRANGWVEDIPTPIVPQEIEEIKEEVKPKRGRPAKDK